MALIAMAVYATEENKRTGYLRRTLECLAETVNLDRHRVILVDNDSCKEAKGVMNKYAQFEKIHIDQNIGTARAINHAWRARRPGENAVKMDDDVIIHCSDWADVLEDAISREKAYNVADKEWEENRMGIIGLKRKDLAETPWRDDWAQSEILRMSHEPGQRWIDVERVGHVMGTCQMYRAELLDKIGYLYQPGLYGFDDALAAARCRAAGYWNAFLLGIEIDHIDPGGTPYNQWKIAEADSRWREVQQMGHEYLTGKKEVFYDPFSV